MTTPDPAAISSRLTQSIEQIVSEMMAKQTPVAGGDSEALVAAMSEALQHVEASRESLDQAASILRSAIAANSGSAALTESQQDSDQQMAASTTEPAGEVIAEEPPVEEATSPEAPTAVRGAHELDIIAHGIPVLTASKLQQYLRDQDAVEAATVREYVNDELRIHLSMKSNLDMTALGTWLNDASGRVISRTDSVVELGFADR